MFRPSELAESVADQKNKDMLVCIEERRYRPFMLDLKRIVVFTRDDDQDYPLGRIAERFAGSDVVHYGEDEPGNVEGVDLVLALGGDGTVLRAMVAFRDSILAINYGNVGFLTQTDKEHLESPLTVYSGDYFVEERLTLEIEHEGQLHRSINELVIRSDIE